MNTLEQLRDKPLPCFFPSCVSKYRSDEKDSSVRCEERGGGWVAECQDCCGGTGSFESREAALDEWNKVARAVLKASSDPAQPKCGSASLFSKTLDEATKQLKDSAGSGFRYEFTRSVIELAMKQVSVSGGRNALNLQMADTARLDWLEHAVWNHPDIGNGIAIFPATLHATGERCISLQGLGDEDGSSLGDDITGTCSTLREAIDKALQTPQAASDGEEHKKQSLGEKES